jgi:hypothetical protein
MGANDMTIAEEFYELPLDPIWRQAAKDAVSQFQYGEVIPREWIISHLDIKMTDARLSISEHQALAFDMLTKVDAFRDELLTKYQRYLVNIRGVGYKIIEPPHQTAAAMTKLQKELRRSISQAMNALVNINDKALSLEDARENVEAKAKLAAFSTLHVNKLDKKTDNAEEKA